MSTEDKNNPAMPMAGVKSFTFCQYVRQNLRSIRSS